MTLKTKLQAGLRQRRAPLAVALSVAMASVLSVTVIATPAEAQRRDRQAKPAQPAAKYSEGFVKAYQAVQPLLSAPTKDAAAMRAQIPALTAAASTADDRFAAGQFILATGSAASDPALQRQGLELMLNSGRVPAADVGRFNFAAGQLAFQAKDFGQARTYFQAAQNARYADKDLDMLLVETYVQENNPAGALTQISGLIDRQKAAGQQPTEELLRKGLATAHNGKLADQALTFAHLLTASYPTKQNWTDAIGVVRANARLNDDDSLDLLRLQRKTNTFSDQREILALIEYADPRRLPNEVSQVIDEGYASGLLQRSNAFATEARTTAQARQAPLRSDLAGLERDANAPGARLATVIAAGNVFLDVGQPAKAEAFFRKALTMPGVDTATTQNRLGIALLNQGKYAEAATAFNQVQGQRAAVARLWAAFASQQAGGSAAVRS